MQVRFQATDSTGQNVLVFPTIATDKGAKLAFYEPTTIDFTNWDGAGVNASGFTFQDGDGYTTGTIASNNATSLVVNSATLDMKNESVNITVGVLTYSVTLGDTLGNLTIKLTNPQGGAEITRPGLIIFEEKDDASVYNALVVTTDAGYDGDSAGIGVNDVVRTWGSDSGGLGNEVQLETDSDLYQDMDIWGSLITLDKSDSDQTTATISYPDDQVEAIIYAGEAGSSISGGTSSGSAKELGSVSVSDAEVNSVAGKNLIVIGGSCINTVASDLLGGAACGESFETATGVGSGSFLIETFARTDDTIATLVAGYNAPDTTNAGKYLITQTVDTTVGMKYIGTSATSATLQTA
jgi:hypothetical protein